MLDIVIGGVVVRVHADHPESYLPENLQAFGVMPRYGPPSPASFKQSRMVFSFRVCARVRNGLKNMRTAKSPRRYIQVFKIYPFRARFNTFLCGERAINKGSLLQASHEEREQKNIRRLHRFM